MDAYGTDSKLLRDRLVVLQDDLNFFPTYDALLLYRSDVPTRFASTWKVLSALQNTISQQTMGELNARAEVDGQSFAAVARDFLQQQAQGDKKLTTNISGATSERVSTRQSFMHVLFGSDFWRLCAQHLFLVVVSLLLAVAAGIPLGVLSFYRPGVGQVVLSVTSVIQTIPSLALLAFLISLFGL